jgi:hypothetical protein
MSSTTGIGRLLPSPSMTACIISAALILRYSRPSQSMASPSNNLATRYVFPSRLIRPSRISSGQVLMKLSNSSVSPLGSATWEVHQGG